LKNSSLKKWFEDFDCDKSGTHSYDTIYEPHFDQYESSFNLLEVGIYKGASSRAFLNCYDNLMYYGIDVFERHNLNIVSDLMSNDRFKVLVADSTSNYVQETIVREWGDIEFDAIIDDGSHLHEDITDTFQNMYPFLRSGGTYYIEDLFPLTFDGLVFDNPQLKGQRNYFLHRPSQFNEGTFGRLIDTIYSFDPANVEHIDLRVQDNRTDSYLIKITKQEFV
jgi:hypothetical protein